jgi:arabinogalactan oligomer/maltooligosaccharide transport system permease protein
MQNASPKVGFFDEIKRHPSLLLVALGSFLVMGLGQLFNRQWLKGLIFFLVPVLFLTIEFGTGSWDKMASGYKEDTTNYFGRMVGKTAETLTADLTTAMGKTVAIEANGADTVDASQLATGFDYGTVVVKADLSGAASGPHGWILSPDAAAALFQKGDTPVAPTDAQVQSLVPLFFTPIQAALAGPLNGTLTTGPSTVVRTADAKVPLSGTVVRVRFSLTIDGTDQGSLVEYFPKPLTEKAVGTDPHAGQTLYPIRDYGGYITRGLWGMVSLGSLVINDDYRGLSIETFNADKPWASADNSSILLARGLIASIIILLYLLMWGLCVADAWSNRKAYLETGKSQSLVDFAKDLWDKAYVWILIAPVALLISFFTVIPFVYTFLCSFTDWTYKVYLLQQLIHWKGLTEYITVFAEPAWFTVFIQVFGWTVLWALISSVTVYVMGFAHALIVESPLVKGKKFWRTVIIIPWALPAMISLLTFRNVFDKDGLMNQLLLQTGLMKPFSNVLYAIGLEGKPDDIIFWFAPPYNANLAKAVAVMVNLWLGAPYFMMLIVGIIATIPADRYEAAMIDGANGFQKFRYITLPMVLNATIPAMVMTVTFNFNNFGAMYFLTGGGPTWLLEKLPDSLRTWTNSMPGQTDILISWIYKISFNANSQLYNKAAVYTVFIFLILGIFSVVNMKMTKAFDDLGEE